MTIELFPLKTVKDIKLAIEQFLAPYSDMEILYSNPWYPFPKYVSEKDTLKILGGKMGIYIYSKPKTQWAIPLQKNDSDIWYIGKSKGTIRGRAWSHLDPMVGEKRKIHENGSDIVATFIAKDWDSRSDVPQDIKDSIVLGKFVVYSVRIDALADHPDLERKLEKYLITSFEMTNGKKPTFNLHS